MTSRTRMTELVKAFDHAGVAAALAETPTLLGVRDERGRTWLHLCCARQPKTAEDVAASIRCADVLLAAGLDLNRPGPDGRTPIEVLRRKKDPAYRALVGMFG